MIPILVSLLLAWNPQTGTATPLQYCDPDDTETIGSSGIPVLMYHHVSDPVNGYYGVSTHRFRMDLQQLDDAGFFLIGPDDISNGLMRVPPDRRPVILTFDDGWQDNLDYLTSTGGDVVLDPDCAVGILEDFCSEHPDFGHGAIFFISWDKVPFGQEEYVEDKMNLLLDLGYTIGNHTDKHTDLTRLSRNKWEMAIIEPLAKFKRRLGLRTSEISTLAYPGGRLPRHCGAEDYISSLRYDGRRAVTMGFLANGSISSFGPLLSSPEGWYRIGRLDMSQYSVAQILQWTNIMNSQARRDLHTPLRRRFFGPSE